LYAVGNIESFFREEGEPSEFKNGFLIKKLSSNFNKSDIKCEKLQKKVPEWIRPHNL